MKFECTLITSDLTGEGTAELSAEQLLLCADGKRKAIDFCLITDLHLLNYHVLIDTYEGRVELAKLGARTEDFFEKLWTAYDRRTQAALFLAGKPERESEGEYEFLEREDGRKGTAKLALYEDALCILPHNVSARRVPLCFCREVVRNGFMMTAVLDTGEQYSFGRLGYDTDPFFEKFAMFCGRSQKLWKERHEALEPQKCENYSVMQACGAEMISGLFTLNDEGFWFAGIRGSKAAVELVTDEKTATYLYEFDCSREDFVGRMRHAMEAVGTNREVIFIDEEKLAVKPLYRMSIDRSAHVRFLRSCSCGRIVHTAQWKEKIRAFFGA